MAQATFQSNIHNHNYDGIMDYALFLSGLNVTHDVLQNYDPLKTGFGRLFMIRKPIYVDQLIPDKMKKFKHMMEYANTGVNGINDAQVNFQQITGGYAGRSFDIPSTLSDDTNRLTVKTYEFSGSPIREVIQFWINGVIDQQTSLSHYYGLDLPVNQANHTAEFIYVATNQTGKEIEYACMFANCFPTSIDNDRYNYNSGEHNIVEMDVEFSCTKYESPQINEKAAQLLAKHQILMNSLNFHSGYTDADLPKTGVRYDETTGKLVRS